MTLKFNPGNHSYYLDGKRTQGVTTILNAGIPKPALVGWAARSVAEYVADNIDQLDQWSQMGRDALVAALKSTPYTARDTAAVRGTDVHALAEEIVHGRAVDVPDHLLAHVEGYVEWLDLFGVEPLLTEVPVASREHRFCGKPDFIGHVRALGDETWLLDWKTSKGVYGETALQTAAYASAEFYVNEGEWDTEHPLPHIDRIGVVHVTEHGTYLHDLGTPTEAFPHFLAAKAVSDGKKWRDKIVGEPTPHPKETP